MKKFTGSLLVTLLLISNIYSADITWIGATSDALNATNWNPNVVPGTNDTGVFSSTATSFTPTYSTSPVSDISIGAFQFSDNSLYNIHVAFGVSRQLILTQAGISNLGSSNQIFSIDNSNSILRLENSASADLTQSGRMIYNVANSGRVRLSDTATASNANINLGASGGLLEFFSNSTAANANITLTGSSTTVTFFNNSKGGNASITSSDQGNIVFTNTSKAESIHLNIDQTTLSFGASSQANNAVINAANSSTVTFQGAATGNDASVNLTTNSQLIINQNITLGTLSADTSSSISLGNDQLTIGSNNVDMSIAGVITGLGGSLIKTGTGALSLNSNNTFTGPLTIEAGKLLGIGSVAGNLNINSGAIFAPGNQAIGTFTVGGDYHQNTGSILQMAVNGTGQSSLVAVAGLASLSGDLQVNSPDGKYTVGKDYLLVNSNTALTGTFNSVTVSSPYFLPTAHYDATHAFLSLAPNFSGNVIDPNSRDVANQIDTLIDPNAAELALINQLAQFLVSELPAGLIQLSGQQYTFLSDLTQHSSNKLIRQIGLLTAVFNPCDCSCCYDSQFWFQGGNVREFISNSHRAKGLNTKSWDINSGFYKCLNSSWLVGACVDYEHSSINFDLSGSGSFNQWKAALFSIYDCNKFYLAVNLLGGFTNARVKRSVNLLSQTYHTKSSPDLSQGILYLEVGKTLCWSNWTFRPFIGFEPGYYCLNSFGEKNGNVVNLHIFNHHFFNFETVLGIHTVKDLPWELTVQADVAWRHIYTTQQNNIHAKFKQFGNKFTVRGTRQDLNVIEGLLQVERSLTNQIGVYAQLYGEKGKHFTSFQGSLGLNVLF